MKVNIFSEFLEFTECALFVRKGTVFQFRQSPKLLTLVLIKILQSFRKTPGADEPPVTVEAWFAEVWSCSDCLGLNSGSAIYGCKVWGRCLNPSDPLL